MKKIIVALTVVLLALVFMGCDLVNSVTEEKKVEYIEIVDANGAPANQVSKTTLTPVVVQLNLELKNYGVEINLFDATVKYSVAAEKQTRTQVELDLSINLLKTAGGLFVDNVVYEENTLKIKTEMVNVE